MKKIVTNNQPRLLLLGYELSTQEKSDFDYIDDIDSENFIRYKGLLFWVGDLCKYECQGEWHGVYSLTYFSSYVFKFSDCGDYVICGYIYS